MLKHILNYIIYTNPYYIYYLITISVEQLVHYEILHVLIVSKIKAIKKN